MMIRGEVSSAFEGIEQIHRKWIVKIVGHDELTFSETNRA